MTDLADVASSLGLPVFACNAAKHPLMAGGFKAASCDPSEIRRQFARPDAAMIGMPTGMASGIVVVDVDVKNGAQGDAWLQANADRLPPTRTHRTRTGGLHLLFRAPADVEIRNSASRVAPGVDVRGQGGYIIVPPSPGYSVADRTEPADMPAWLIECCLKPRPQPEPPPEPRRHERHADSIHGSRYGLAALERECDAIARAAPGCQEQSLNDGSLRMGSLVAAGVLDARHAHSRLVEAGLRMSNGDASWPWSRNEIADKVERALTDGAQRPRIIREREMRRDPPRGAQHPRQHADTMRPDTPGHTQGKAGQEPDSRTRPDIFPLLRFEQIQPRIDAGDFLQGIFIRGSAAVVYGESNAGKTFWMTDVALHVAAGKEWQGRRVEGGPVIYVALEGGIGFANRVAAWRTANGLEDAVIPFFAIVHPINMLDPEADMPRFLATLRAVADEVGEPILVVIDTLSRALSGGDENSSEDMGALVRNMDQVRAEIGSCVAFIHHSGKDSARGARGHSLLRAAVDTEIEVKAEEGSDLKTATTVKQRDMAKGQVMPFRLEVVELGRNRHGEAVTTCLVAAAHVEEGAGSDGHKIKLSGDSRQAFDVLVDLLNEKGRPGFPSVPPHTVSIPDEWWREAFYSRCKIGAERKAKEKAFRRAADTLTQSGLVAANAGRVWVV